MCSQPVPSQESQMSEQTRAIKSTNMPQCPCYKTYTPVPEVTVRDPPAEMITMQAIKFCLNKSLTFICLLSMRLWSEAARKMAWINM